MTEAQAKQWEVRAALRLIERSRTSTARDIPGDILRAAIDLAESDAGGDFTVKEAAERAGVALQTVYRYFGSKDELLLAMFEETVAQGMQSFFAETADAAPVERLRHLVVGPIGADFDQEMRRRLAWRARERARLRESHRDAVEAVFEPYRSALVAALHAVCESGEGEVDDVELVASVLTFVVERLILGSDVEDGGEPAAVAESIWKLFWNGIGRRHPPKRR